MEPRPEGRGDTPDRSASKIWRKLQWSHGPKAVETSRLKGDVTGMKGFNGATARRPWRQVAGEEP